MKAEEIENLEHLSYLEDVDIENTSVKDHPNRIRFNDAINAPPVTPALTNGGETLLEPNELCGIVGAPGVGKSQGLESIIYSFWCTKYDIPIDWKRSLNFSFSKESTKGNILHLDTERTVSDINQAMKRLSKRLGKNFNTDEFYTILTQNQQTSKENAETLESELQRAEKNGTPYSVVILDGILDVSPGGKDLMMDSDGGIQTIKFLNKLANKHNCLIFATIHPNPESERMSGHIGGSLQKWARCVLMFRRKKGFKDVFEITVNFRQGKQSHGKPMEDVNYIWNDDLGMNTAVSYADIEDRKSKVGPRKKPAPFEWYKTDEQCKTIVKNCFEGVDIQDDGSKEIHGKAFMQEALSLAIKEDTNDAVLSSKKPVDAFIEYLVNKNYLMEVNGPRRSKVYRCANDKKSTAQLKLNS